MKDAVTICRFRTCRILTVPPCIYTEGGRWDDTIASLYEEIELALNYETATCMKRDEKPLEPPFPNQIIYIFVEIQYM